ncbi:unnamed protein product [Thelazia callipaeda]|uniref:Zinc metalloproteinase n=1 Tax=Thelazia callipaeda TaxID=103827 RepID=A0A158RB22_THECL|nr:unnamed protein product [Thelazia callipaeda]
MIGYALQNSKIVSNALKNIPTNDGTEASINRREGVVGHLFENDILLTLPQVKSLLRSNKNNKWQRLIRITLRQIEMETCVRFRENAAHEDYILFIQGNGCWSNVGRIGGPQLVSIGFGCEATGIIAHEVLHALGLWHEQSRDDRDNYIKINYDNIYAGTEGNFEKRSQENSDNMGLSYDLGSVMHYGATAFTTNIHKLTIETREQLYQQTIGQRMGVSFKDAKIINLRYCTDICAHEKICYNGGYVNPNNCRQCKCPAGFAGDDCSSVEKSTSSKCGGELLAAFDYQSINSTNLDGDNIRCIWRIKSQTRVVMYVEELKLPCQEPCSSYLELKYRSDMSATGPRLCCNKPIEAITSETDTFVVIYATNANNDDHFTHSFKLQFRKYNPKRVTLPPYSTTSTEINFKKLKQPKDRINCLNLEPAQWSEWGEWSTCSVSCGGCGVRRRIRACYGGNRQCPGSKEDVMECGARRCPVWEHYDCYTRLIMPCDLLQNLQFITEKDVYVVFNEKKHISNQWKQSISDKKLAVSRRRMCQKYFNHQCSTSIMTFRMEWNTENKKDQSDLDERGCCHGYHYNNTACVPIRDAIFYSS